MCLSRTNSHVIVRLKEWLSSCSLNQRKRALREKRIEWECKAKPKDWLCSCDWNGSRARVVKALTSRAFTQLFSVCSPVFSFTKIRAKINLSWTKGLSNLNQGNGSEKNFHFDALDIILLWYWYENIASVYLWVLSKWQVKTFSRVVRKVKEKYSYHGKNSSREKKPGLVNLFSKSLD